jgi:pimeloyl-ACP methyl ester carboxylesterase
MSKVFLSLLACFCASLCLAAEAPHDPNDNARAVIADIQHIATPDGVEERFSARIGGIDQWFTVRGRHRDNPILLYVHGGPGSTAMPMSWAFQRPWEEYFTVVQWDQRAAGKTYRANNWSKIESTLTVERYVDDAVEVMALLREKYAKRKIVVLGHSWGSVLGLEAAMRAPEWVSAYVGIGQFLDLVENERVGYDSAVALARADRNKTALKELASIAPYPGGSAPAIEALRIQRKWTIHYGGLQAYRHDAHPWFAAADLSPDYDAADLAAFNAGTEKSLGSILKQIYDERLDLVRKVEFPVILLLGRHDLTTPPEASARWLDRLDAPVKRAIWFEDSAHLLPMEEPGKTLVTLVQTVLPLALASED